MRRTSLVFAVLVVLLLATGPALAAAAPGAKKQCRSVGAWRICTMPGGSTTAIMTG